MDVDRRVREAAYYIWENAGCPEGKALDHWARAVMQIECGDDGLLLEEERVLADLPADLPAILTKDTRGG